MPSCCLNIHAQAWWNSQYFQFLLLCSACTGHMDDPQYKTLPWTAVGTLIGTCHFELPSLTWLDYCAYCSHHHHHHQAPLDLSGYFNSNRDILQHVFPSWGRHFHSGGETAVERVVASIEEYTVKTETTETLQNRCIYTRLYGLQCQNTATLITYISLRHSFRFVVFPW